MTVRHCIVATQTNLVINAVDYETDLQAGPAPGLENCIAVASTEAQVGWTWNGQSLTAPNTPPAPVTARDVNDERDRRLMHFSFGGHVYDFDPVSRGRIETARNSAGWAIVAGAQPNDLRWGDANVDFGWIRADNGITLMDAHTTLAFGNAAAAWEGLHIIAARILKDQTPIPEDFTSDSYWPA